MAERLAYLEAVVGADITQFRRGMRDVRNEVGLFGEAMEGITAIGRSLTLAVTTPLVTLGTYAVQAASDFDAAMRNINSLLFLTEEQLDTLGDDILAFGSNLRGGAVKAAEAYYIAVSAGIEDAALAFEFMKIASMTAEAGLADLEITTEALTAAFLSYGGATLEAAEQTELLKRASDVLTMTVGLGVGSMDTFATALGKVFPTAVAVGGSLESVGATMAYLTQRGLTAARAGTSLEAALTSLLKPSEAMKQSFAELGVQTGDELIEKFGSLEEALIAVIETADGSATRLGQIFLSKEARRAVQLIFDDLDQYRAAVEAFNEGVDGVTARAHEQQMQSFAAHWDLMTAALQGAAITIGDVMLPVLIPVIDHITELLNTVVQANPQVVALGVGFAALAAGISPVIWLVGSLVNPLTAAITAVGALSTAFVLDFGNIQSIVSDTLDSIFGDLTEFKDTVSSIFEALFPPTLADDLKDAVPTVDVAPEDVVKIEVKEGDTLWGIWFADFKDQFTWEEFKEAVGWEEGHVLQPGEILTVNGQQFREGLLGLFDHVAVTGRDIIQRIFAHVMPEDKTDIIPPEFRYHLDGVDRLFDQRLVDARYIFNTTLRPILEGMVENARAWFDEKVGEGLAWIANLFESAGGTGGNTPIYRAVSALLDLDITRAINEVIPNLGTEIGKTVGGWGKNILEAFPTIRENITKLIESVSGWVVDEGLPTLVRTAGHLGASLAAALYDAVAAAIGFITSPAIGDATNSVAGYVSGTLLPEFIEGWNEGLADTALQTQGIPALETLFSQIGAVLDAINVDKIVEGLGGLGEGLADFANDLAGADWSGVTKLLGIIGYLSAGLFMLRASILGAALENAGDTLSTLGDGIASFVDALADIGNQDPRGALRNLAEGIFIFAMAPIQGLAGALDLLVAGIENLFNIDLNLPDFTTEIGNWLEGLKAAWDRDAVFEDVVTFTPTGIDIIWDNEAELQVAVGELRERYPAIGEAISAYIQTHPLEASAGVLILGFRDNTDVQVDPDVVNQLLLENLPDEEIAYRVGTIRIVTDEGTDIRIAAANAPLSAVSDPNTTVTTTVSNIEVDAAEAAVVGQNIPETILPSESLANHFSEEAYTAAERFAEQMVTQFAEGGIADPTVVETNFLQPLETSFVNYLGDDSEIVKTLASFIDTTQEKTIEAVEAFEELRENTGTTMAALLVSVFSAAPGVVLNLNSIRGAVDMLAGAFLGLAAAANAAVAAVNLANGLGFSGGGRGVEFGGARAKGGDVEAGKSYLVGEDGVEIFTPTRSGSIISTDAIFSALGERGGGDTIYQTVNIYEVSNLDDLLYEAERRGIRLGR